MQNEKWMVKNKKADFSAICKEFGVSEVIARLLVNRSMENFEDIRRYLYPEVNCMYAPDTMKDLVKTCSVILHKIEEKRKIRIIGDYDVDGIISTYVLLQGLQKCGANVDYQIPDRMKDGYGINIDILKKCYEDGIDTVITCDNGISAREQIAFAKSLGMTILITDHHDIPEELPAADSIVNPKQEDCIYPYKGLCGAGVVYKLVQELFKCIGIGGMEAEYLQYIAIATVCDVMELTDENRIIVKLGLEQLRQTKNYGLRALIEVTGIDQNKLSTYHLGFVIGPCLNASGRLQSATLGLNLMLSESEESAKSYAAELHRLNALRKDMTAKSLENAIAMLEETGLSRDKVLVIYLPECHESLAGIIAGRVREAYYKPVIVLTNGEENVKGSGRSIEQYHLYSELAKQKDYLLKFGGHPMAAGLSLLEEQIEPLRKALNEQCALSEEDFLAKVSIDAVLALSGISEDLVEELEQLEPFGKGNEKPVFAEKDLMIQSLAVFGKATKVAKMKVMDRFGKIMDAVYFGDIDGFLKDLNQHFGEDEVRKMYQNRAVNSKISVTYYPGINEYSGMRTLQIVIQNYKFSL